MPRPDIAGYGMTLHEGAEQVSSQTAGAGESARPVAVRYWGTDYALNILNGHIRLSMQARIPTTAARAQHESLFHGPPIRAPDALPIHVDATLLGSPTDVRLRFVATDAPLALAEATGSDSEIARRRWRSREARSLDEALGAADRHRDEFLAVLSHELRSPLAAIRNAIHLVCSPTTEAQARQRAQALLERQLQCVLHLVDDLRDLSLLTFGRIPLNRERMDLRIAVNNAIETLEPDIRRRRHRLTVALPGTPVWLQGDGRRLEQVFVNLLANGCKFTHTGGELDVRLQASDGQATVQFRDSGIGLEAQALPHIFDPFKQVDEGSPRSEAGLGIGLALVRQFVKLHGGSVMVCSAGLGKGCEFTVQLPTQT